MPTPKKRNERQQLRDRHSAEIEASQAELRRSITETERLVGESDKMLRRHREESDEVDAGPSSSITKDDQKA
jgi:hypothetical protein